MPRQAAHNPIGEAKAVQPATHKTGRRPVWAIIFKPWADQPVYHAHERIQWYAPGFRGYKWVTLCGRPIGEHTPWLPMKHVVRFGRPCKGCFPG